MRKIILPIIAFLTLACHASSKDKKLEKKESMKNRDVAASNDNSSFTVDKKVITTAVYR